MKVGVISSKDLGIQCWSSVKALGGECDKVGTCKHAQREHCKAYRTHFKMSYEEVRTDVEGNEKILSTGTGFPRKH